MNDTLSNTLQEAYDVDTFRQTGHQLVDLLADHLRKCKDGEGPVINYIAPEEEYQYWKSYKMDSLEGFYQDLLSRTIHTHHRRYIGHQVAAPAYVPALSGLLSELLNAGMGIYEMGAAATALERIVVREFCQKVGYDDAQGDGFLTSGGTLANLTALLAARASLSKDLPGKPVILVSDQAHFCIDRAAMTMGMKEEQVIKIKTQEDFTVDLKKLEEEILTVKEVGNHILAVVGCACSTSTGSYDDIEALADICEKHKIWLHVDGAHGGAAAWSQKYSYLTRAQSIIIDAHKMMMTPALATAVLFKEPSDSYKALATKAEYLWEESEREWYLLAKRTYETTKLMMSIKVYSLIKAYGHEVIDEYVTRQYDLAKYFAQEISKTPSLELAHEPMANIVCFRYISDSDVKSNELNKFIRQSLLEDGDYYIVQTVLHEKTYLRVTIMSPYTTKQDLNELIALIINKGQNINKDKGLV